MRVRGIRYGGIFSAERISSAGVDHGKLPDLDLRELDRRCLRGCLRRFLRGLLRKFLRGSLPDVGLEGLGSIELRRVGAQVLPWQLLVHANIDGFPIVGRLAQRRMRPGQRREFVGLVGDGNRRGRAVNWAPRAGIDG